MDKSNCFASPKFHSLSLRSPSSSLPPPPIHLSNQNHHKKIESKTQTNQNRHKKNQTRCPPFSSIYKKPIKHKVLCSHAREILSHRGIVTSSHALRTGIASRNSKPKERQQKKNTKHFHFHWAWNEHKHTQLPMSVWDGDLYIYIMLHAPGAFVSLLTKTKRNQRNSFRKLYIQISI